MWTFSLQPTDWVGLYYYYQHFYFSLADETITACAKRICKLEVSSFYFWQSSPDRHAEHGRLRAWPGQPVWWMFRDGEISIITSECILYVLHNESCRCSNWHKKAIHSSYLKSHPPYINCTVVRLSLLIPDYLHIQSSWHLRVHSDIGCRQ